MNAWTNDLDGLRVKSVALPRDGGVMNADTIGRYRITAATDLAGKFKKEERRIKAEAAAKVAAAAADRSLPALMSPAVVTLLSRVQP